MATLYLSLSRSISIYLSLSLLSLKALSLVQCVSDLDFWLSGVEAQLSSSDTGRDLGGAQTLLKKQQLLEADITAHQVTPLNLECMIL